MIDQCDAAADGARTPGNAQRAAAILAELLDALRSTALTIADDQRLRAAGEVSAVAEAARAAAKSLDRSEIHVVAGGADRLADRIDWFASAIHERRWGEIGEKTKRFAGRRPILFSFGAAAAGFFAGRLLSLSAERREQPAREPATDAGET